MVFYETYQPFDARVREDALREKFTRRAGDLLPLTADLKDPLPWNLSITIPPKTTLLDFTYSPDLARCFALERRIVGTIRQCVCCLGHRFDLA